MTQQLSQDVRLELARSAAEYGGCVRLAMRGSSMLPLLHEPQVLEVTPLRGQSRIGEIVVFRRGGRHVAHRVVRVEPGGVVTSGDSQPDRFERVAREEILGRVSAVWSDGAAQPHRVDGPAFRLRGVYFARCYSVRRAFALARKLAMGVQAPWKRPRGSLRLYEMLRAPFNFGARGSPAVVSDALVEAALRHRCAAFLTGAAVSEQLQRAMLGAQLNTMSLARELERVIRVLRSSGVPVVLLKGAARIRTGGEDMRAHPSTDIDVLVPPESEDAAVAALVRDGYAQRASPAAQRRYRSRHHHAAPLYRRGHRPVEVHRALAPAHFFGTPTGWNALAPYLVEVDQGVYVLNAFACALHAALHSPLTFLLRDIVFLAASLQRMTDEERVRLRNLIRSEPLDPVRPGGILALASDLALVPYDEKPLEHLYRRWLLRRSDLPAYLRNRAQAVDAAFLLCCGRPRQAWRIFSLEARGVKIAARLLSGCAALAYALLMRDAP